MIFPFNDVESPFSDVERTFSDVERRFNVYERRFLYYTHIKRADLTASPSKILSKIQIGMT